MLGVLVAIGLLMASSCVLNNIIDRHLDKKMSRTKTRALSSGRIKVKNAYIYASVLMVFGFLILAIFSNILTVFLGLLAVFSYVVVYGYAKRKTVHGTLIGTFPGALPPVAGYSAITGSLDLSALLLFLALVFWQLPHFYSISLFRKKDYESANIPVMPVVKGVVYTKNVILINIIFLLAVIELFYIYDLTSIFFSVAMIPLVVCWFFVGSKNYMLEGQKWGKKMFLFSLIVLLTFSMTISLDSYFFS